MADELRIGLTAELMEEAEQDVLSYATFQGC